MQKIDLSSEKSAFTLAEGATHVTQQHDNRKIAFTLAEVLITLGIIGVVAAMTMPVVVNKYKEKVTVTSLKKAYSVLQQSLLFAINENGDPEEWTYTTYEFDDDNGGKTEKLTMDLDIIVKYMNLAQDCGHEAKGCFADKYTQLNGKDDRDFENLSYYRKVITTDGVSLAIQGYSQNPTAGRGEIWVDINGKKKPNVIGKDMFLFLVGNSKVYPYGKDLTQTKQQRGCSLKDRVSAGSGYSCALQVLTRGNLDYLN